MSCLLITGSNFGEGRFSLSSDMHELPNASLENIGLVGVAGMSSDRSEAVVETLMGVHTLGECVRTGVMGKASVFWSWKRPPWR